MTVVPLTGAMRNFAGPTPLLARWRGRAAPANRRCVCRAASLIGVLLIPACTDVIGVGEEPPEVRHVAGTEFYRNDAQYHLFIFDPLVPRPLAERIRGARNSVADEPDCRWVDAPPDLLEKQTAKQGERYADTMLVAPLRCT